MSKLDLTADTTSYLQQAKSMWPLVSSHWSKMETLTLPQALWLYYEIEPNNEIDFQDFINFGDEERLWPVMQSAMANNNLPLLRNQILDVVTFVRWLQQKGLKIPQIFRECLSSRNSLNESMLQTADDVKRIDFNKLPPSVLKCLGANVIAQFKKREAEQKGEEIKISTVMQSNYLKKFLEECCSSDGKLPSNDTVRQYIEQQFRKPKR